MYTVHNFAGVGALEIKTCLFNIHFKNKHYWTPCIWCTLLIFNFNNQQYSFYLHIIQYSSVTLKDRSNNLIKRKYQKLQFIST